jgi:NNP family nitrate/nitrite transporter-like MFS transporter
MGLIDLFFADDCPQGKWHQGGRRNSNEKASPLESKADVENMPRVSEHENVARYDASSQEDTESLSSVNSQKNTVDSLLVFLKTLYRPAVLILVVQYACCFGLELSVDNIIAAMFNTRFDLSLTTSSYIGSVFGLLNLFSRLSGGLFNDFLYRKWRLPGRILSQFIIITCEGCFLIGFSYSLGRLDSSIVMMVIFSLFVQGAAGSTFALAPFVDPVNSGTVMGIIGGFGKSFQNNVNCKRSIHKLTYGFRCVFRLFGWAAFQFPFQKLW